MVEAATAEAMQARAARLDRHAAAPRRLAMTWSDGLVST